MQNPFEPLAVKLTQEREGNPSRHKKNTFKKSHRKEARLIDKSQK